MQDGAPLSFQSTRHECKGSNGSAIAILSFGLNDVGWSPTRAIFEPKVYSDPPEGRMATKQKKAEGSFRYSELMERWGVDRRVVRAAADEGKIQRSTTKGIVRFSADSVVAFEQALKWQPGKEFPFCGVRGTMTVADQDGTEYLLIDEEGNRHEVPAHLEEMLAKRMDLIYRNLIMPGLLKQMASEDCDGSTS